ncbi:MAG: alpha/beta fold hydrolase [Phycisphaeraceae bacterium]|nr:alpha/beta fold hydrolase [Phycisphaeraceae bacterium]MCW5753294.1 alpha/beta fold hydrolase [Phycisphaeraceae bacterium]
MRTAGVIAAALGFYWAGASGVALDLPQPAAEGVRADAGRPARVSARRIDLARAFQRFERAALARDPQGEALAELNRRVDALAMMFLSGRMGQALEELDVLSAELLGLEDEAREAWLAAASLRVRAYPSWIVSPEDDQLDLIIETLHGTDRRDRLHEAELVVTMPSSGISWEWPLKDRMDFRGTARAPFPVELRKPGTADLWIRVPGTQPMHMGRLWMLEYGTLDVYREGLLREFSDPRLAPHRQVDVASVIAQMTDDQDALVWLVDSPEALVRTWRKELQTPPEQVRLRPGHHRGVFRLGGASSPVIVFAPNQITEGTPLPLVIALHGAGGDEHLWIDGYGAGMLTDLAREKGFIVASPLAYPLLGNGMMLDALLDDIAQDFDFDRSRVYLIGHSMGAMGASALAQMRPRTIAAVCAIAGAAPLQAGRARAPMLVFGAEHDRIVPPGRVERQVRPAIDAGEAVEYRLVPHQGHTLIVPAVLPEAIDWLLGHRLE